MRAGGVAWDCHVEDMGRVRITVRVGVGVRGWIWEEDRRVTPSTQRVKATLRSGKRMVSPKIRVRTRPCGWGAGFRVGGWGWIWISEEDRAKATLSRGRGWGARRSESRPDPVVEGSGFKLCLLCTRAWGPPSSPAPQRGGPCDGSQSLGLLLPYCVASECSLCTTKGYTFPLNTILGLGLRVVPHPNEEDSVTGCNPRGFYCPTVPPHPRIPLRMPESDLGTRPPSACASTPITVPRRC